MAAKKEFLLRIDPALWNELQGWASDELRSVNGQIEYILRNAIAKHRGSKKADDDDSPQHPEETA